MLAKDMIMKGFRGEAGVGGAWGASIGPTMCPNMGEVSETARGRP